MKNNQYKQNNYEKKIQDDVKKSKKKFARFYRLTPEQQNKSVNNLLNRSQTRAEILKQIKEILQSTENLAIKDIQEKLGINRNTFNYWIDKFEKEKIIHRKSIENLGGKDKRGNPKTLILNKEYIEWQEDCKKKYWESEEEKMLNNLLIEQILREINEQQPPDKKYKKLIELFKKYKKESFGARMIFLSIGAYVNINYKFSLTERGKELLKKIEKNKKGNE